MAGKLPYRGGRRGSRTGIFGTTKGLVEKFGTDRVVEMPVAENGLTGIAVGSALLGRRPIMTHQRVDRATRPRADLRHGREEPLRDKWPSPSASYYPHGHRPRLGPGPTALAEPRDAVSYMPGLKVVMPTTPSNTKGMLLAAIQDDNPVIFLEHRWLHYVTGPVKEGFYTLALDGPHVARRGGDVTIVASSYMVLEALRAATALADAGCEAEILDLAVLRPPSTLWGRFGPSARRGVSSFATSGGAHLVRAPRSWRE